MEIWFLFRTLKHDVKSNVQVVMCALGLACCVWLVGLSGGCLPEDAPKADSHQLTFTQRHLNNLVTELAQIPLPQSGQRVAGFENPKDGWVFFKVPATVTADQLTVSLNKNPGGLPLFSSGTGGAGEAMQWLSAGMHDVTIRSQGASGVLLIRAIPEIMLMRVGIAEYYDPAGTNAGNNAVYLTSKREQHGADRLFLYYWNYLRKNVLQHYNVVDASSSTQAPGLQEWTAAGRKLVGSISLHNMSNAYERWSPYFKPPYSGIILDEFVPPRGTADVKEGYSPGLGFDEETMGVIKKIHETDELAGSVYGFLGVPSSVGAKSCLPLLETLIPRGYKWAYERYLWPQPTEAETRAQLDKVLRQPMLDFETQYPGCVKSCLLTLATLYQWDSQPRVHQKTWLDLQVQLIASDPVFDGLFGLSYWSPTVTDPELVEWMSQLFRHYAIEGQTNLLSSQYGYKLMLDHLVNSDFSEGNKGWEFQEAEPGSIRFVALADLPIKQGYLPTTRHMLTLRRDAERPNVVSQTINNLKPGHLYSCRMFVCDPHRPVDMQDPATWQIYAQSVQFKGAQELAERRRQDLQRGDGLVKEICWNYIYRVFRATGETAVLEISDWAAPSASGGPVGQTLAYTNIKIQPLFEPNDPAR